MTSRAEKACLPSAAASYSYYDGSALAPFTQDDSTHLLRLLVLLPLPLLLLLPPPPPPPTAATTTTPKAKLQFMLVVCRRETGLETQIQELRPLDGSSEAPALRVNCS